MKVIILLVSLIVYSQSDKLFDFGIKNVIYDDFEFKIPKWSNSPKMSGSMKIDDWCIVKLHFENRGYLTAFDCPKVLQNGTIYNCFYYSSSATFSNYYSNILQNSLGSTHQTEQYLTKKTVNRHIEEIFEVLERKLNNEMRFIETSQKTGLDLKLAVPRLWDDLWSFDMTPMSDVSLCIFSL